MLCYKNFAPTGFDTRGLGLEDRQDWYVVIGTNRDADALTRSNFEVILKDLGGEGENVEVHRFGHWANGWFELILVRPETAESLSALEWEAALENYPVADDSHFSNLEYKEACHTWQCCFSDKQRLAYIRDHRSQFDFRDWAEVIGNVRGTMFSGYSGELLT